MRNLAGMLHSVYFGTLLALKKEKYFFDSFWGGESHLDQLDFPQLPCIPDIVRERVSLLLHVG